MSSLFSRYLNQVIDEGIAGAKKSYPNPEQKSKLDGSIAGFEACRGKTLEEIQEIATEIDEYQQQAFREHHDEYWYFRCYQAEVQFVLSRLRTMIFLTNGNM